MKQMICAAIEEGQEAEWVALQLYEAVKVERLGRWSMSQALMLVNDWMK
jgi:hypothetical protein